MSTRQRAIHRVTWCLVHCLGGQGTSGCDDGTGKNMRNRSTNITLLNLKTTSHVQVYRDIRVQLEVSQRGQKKILWQRNQAETISTKWQSTAFQSTAQIERSLNIPWSMDITSLRSESLTLHKTAQRRQRSRLFKGRSIYFNNLNSSATLRYVKAW